MSPIAAIVATSVAPEAQVGGQARELAALVLDRPRAGAGLLDQGRHDAFDGGVGKVPLAGELHRGQAGLGPDRLHALDPLKPARDPALGPEAAMVVLAQWSPRVQVAPEQPAVVDHAGDHSHVVCRGGVEDHLARPRLERVQDDHRPVDLRPEALQARDQVEREPVGRARRDPDPVGESRVLLSAAIPARRRRTRKGAVRVVQEENVEPGDADRVEASLGGAPQVRRVVVGAAQRRVREPREALRPLALPKVEIMADRPDERTRVAIHAGQRPAGRPVRLAFAVDIGRQDRVDPVPGAQQRLEALVVELLAEMHEAAAAPGSDCRPARDHRPGNVRESRSERLDYRDLLAPLSPPVEPFEGATSPFPAAPYPAAGPRT